MRDLPAPSAVAPVKHTPGPWEFHEDEMDIVAADGVSICHVLNSGDFPCITDDEHKSEEENRADADAECEANAKLIVSAPHILAVLGQIAGPELFNIAVNDVEVSPERMRALLGEIYELARVAANKAEA